MTDNKTPNLLKNVKKSRGVGMVDTPQPESTYTSTSTATSQAEEKKQPASETIKEDIVKTTITATYDTKLRFLALNDILGLDTQDDLLNYLVDEELKKMTDQERIEYNALMGLRKKLDKKRNNKRKRK